MRYENLKTAIDRVSQIEDCGELKKAIRSLRERLFRIKIAKVKRKYYYDFYYVQHFYDYFKRRSNKKILGRVGKILFEDYYNYQEDIEEQINKRNFNELEKFLDKFSIN